MIKFWDMCRSVQDRGREGRKNGEEEEREGKSDRWKKRRKEFYNFLS